MSSNKRRRKELSDLIEGDVITSSVLKGPHIVIESGVIHISSHNESWTDREITLRKLRADGTYNPNAKTTKWSMASDRVQESRLPDFQFIKHMKKIFV